MAAVREHWAADVGRESELNSLRAEVLAALAGCGRLVLLGGPAGIGKTTLAEALVRYALAQGMRVVRSHGRDLAALTPYGPWREVTDTLTWQTTLPDVAGAAAHAGAKQTTRLTTQQPLLLLLEDLHWADRSSLTLLRLLAWNLTGTRMLLLATYRTDLPAPQNRLVGLLPTLVRGNAVRWLTLGGLRAGEIAALLRMRYTLSWCEEQRLVGFLQLHTGGNPAFISEWLRTLEARAVLSPARPDIRHYHL